MQYTWCHEVFNVELFAGSPGIIEQFTADHWLHSASKLSKLNANEIHFKPKIWPRSCRKMKLFEYFLLMNLRKTSFGRKEDPRGGNIADDQI